METELAIVPEPEEDSDTAFPLEVGKIFVLGAALGAGVYGGKLLIDWIAVKYVFRKNGPMQIPPTEAK